MENHIHQFVRLVRLSNPSIDSWDCSCGARKQVVRGGSPESVDIESDKGSSVENALINLSSPGKRILYR